MFKGALSLFEIFCVFAPDHLQNNLLASSKKLLIGSLIPTFNLCWQISVEETPACKVKLESGNVRIHPLINTVKDHSL